MNLDLLNNILTQMKKAKIIINNKLAGILTESEDGYEYSYAINYLENKESEPISLTLPLSSKPYYSSVLFPFFDGLIPEGWLLEIATKNWKFDPRDRMSILLTTCKDCIGAVSVEPIEIVEND